jgi:drug/metabolite transporter (DMT)-like permease
MIKFFCVLPTRFEVCLRIDFSVTRFHHPEARSPGKWSSNMALYSAVLRRYLSLRARECGSRSPRSMSTTVTQSRFGTDPQPPASSAHASNATLVIVAFAAVYLIWGSTYLAIRVGIESFPPLLLAGTRHLVFGIIFYPLLRWKTGIRPTAANWRTVCVTGFLLLLMGNGGVCVAEQTVPSGVAALLVATVSLWMVIVDWWRPGGTRPVARVIGGLVMGFAGLALLVGPKDLGGSTRVNLTGASILLVASFAWACGSLYSKHGQMPGSALLGSAMQSLTGGTALWVVGAATGELRSLHLAAVSTRSWIAIAYLIFFGSMIGFTAYIYILKHSTATRVATYAFVNPVVALSLGWLFLGEPITSRTILAAAIILGAVLLVITAPHRPAVAPAAAIPETVEA